MTYQIVLTKADQVRPAELAARIDRSDSAALARRPAALPGRC